MSLTLGISACLMGQKVRYDGRDKASSYCIEQLSQHVNLQAFCPEVAIGLGVPRPPIQLEQRADGIAVVSVHNPNNHDFAPALNQYAQHVLTTHPKLCGFILMQKSPSCGLYSSKIKQLDGSLTLGTGAFAQGLQTQRLYLPLIEEQQLTDKTQLAAFLTAAFALQDCQLLLQQTATTAQWQALHAKYKYQLMVSDNAIYKRLGKQLSKPNFSDISYANQFISALQKPTTIGQHYNGLLHIAGYFKNFLTASERQAIHTQLQAFHQQQCSLAQAIDRLRKLQLSYPHPYLAKQFYLYMPEVIYNLYQE